MVTAGSEVLLAPQTVTRTRIYTYDELQVLAKDHEEAMLREALAREIAGVISRRLAEIEIPVT
jgi:outer membrane lipopolysaccharide assembly protein LptE/RlpB